MENLELISILEAQQEILKELLKHLKISKHLSKYEDECFKNLFSISTENLEILKSRLKP